MDLRKPRWLRLLIHLVYCMNFAKSEIPYTSMTINGQFYFLSETISDSIAAASLCSSQLPAELAFFDTNDEYHTVADYLTSYCSSSNLSLEVWVHINSIDINRDNVYEHWWKTEQLDPLLWAKDEPNTCCWGPLNGQCCARIAWKAGVFNYLHDRTCTDIVYNFLCKSLNECKENKHNCSDICFDAAFGFECLCNAGYFLEDDKANCSDVDECVSNPCSQICANTPGAYNCSCFPGYHFGSDGHSCQDVNECSYTGVCNHICTEVNGSYVCSCFPGYITDTTTCQALEECLQVPNPCPGTCVNTEGSYFCGCIDGFEVAQNKCVDVDECALEADECSQLCHNTPGSYNCSCREGYIILNSDIRQCTDIDECTDKTHPCDDICWNSEGSFSCSCANGYTLDPTDRISCHDINECVEHPNICQHRCTNTNGSFFCTCNLGYTLLKDGVSCIEVSNARECQCSCWQRTLQENYIPGVFRKETEDIHRGMIIDKNKLSSSNRKMTSVLDTRISSRAIGGSGIVLLTMFFCVIVLSDVVNFVRYALLRYTT